jgi:hypothetical protein
MKVKSLVKATKEFERLQSLIEKIEKYLEDFAKVNTVSNDGLTVYASCGTLTINGYSLSSSKKEEKVSVTIDGSVAELVRDDVVDLLKSKLVELKREQDNLEL